MRKKKWADPYLQEHGEYVLQDPAQYKGKWKQLFGCEILHVEIGAGKGDYLIGMSSMYPDEGWVGIEKDHSAAAVAARKVCDQEQPDLHNKRLIVSDAEHLEEWFAPQEVDVIHLNFSDPWPKTYTHKRRLSSERFLTLYKQILTPNGKIRMKTDNKGLFEDSVLYFLQNGFTFTQFSVDYRRNEHPEDAVTEYEKRFMDLSRPIYQLEAVCVRKNDVLE